MRLLRFAKNHFPDHKRLQQDEQDFDDWLECCPTGIYFSWPKGKPSHTTIAVDLKTNVVSFRSNLSTEDSADYKVFADLLREWLSYQTT